jgi:tripartite-type tricarboxylate transporter receptor subunit TctC
VARASPFAAGGPTDLIGRIMAPRMSEVLGQQIVIENMGGACGMTGASRVARAADDGYQFVLGGLGTFILNQLLYKKPPFDTKTPVALVADQAQILIARKDFPADNLRDFISYAKANPKLAYGSAGIGSASHACSILLNSAMGTNLIHVPYRGSAPVVQDLQAGRLDFGREQSSSALPHIQANTIKAIAVPARERIAFLPELPTAREQGVLDVEAEPWFAYFLPKATPEAIVNKLHAAAVAAMNAGGRRAPAERRGHAGGAGTTQSPLPRRARRERDQKMGRRDQGQRRVDGLTEIALTHHPARGRASAARRADGACAEQHQPSAASSDCN